MTEPRIIDARGHQCPVPTLKLRRALEESSPGAVLALLATDPMARIDAPHLMASVGGLVLSIAEDEGVLTITVSAPAGSAGPPST